ncbi:MAG: sugar phosphate isomerase/epimerase [Planctomycetes bacterium]|nr:sugar phosphate isomerase/epimerase [Planctomycetota bacterium]
MRSRLGIVSNCWKNQLDGGATLASLVERGLEIGLRHFELRQGALGDCETEDRLPIPAQLASLADHFSLAAFDLAVEMPVVTGASPLDADFESRCIESAVALASEASPIAHLRIVDLAGPDVGQGDARKRSLETLVRLDESLRKKNTQSMLSLEHSIQRWLPFRSLFDEVRAAIDLKLCFDPCNLWLCDEAPPLTEIVSSLDPASISMLHVKQRDEASPGVRVDIGPGAVPWPELLRQLDSAGYFGPILFETAPCEDVIEQTEANCQRVEKWLAEARQ